MPHIGNTKDPVLKPWAARQTQDSNDEGAERQARTSAFRGNC